MEEHYFAYSFTKEYTIVLFLDLHPMYFQYQLSDGSSEQAETLQIQPKHSKLLDIQF